MLIFYIILLLLFIYIIFLCFRSFRKNEFNMFGFNFFKYTLMPLFRFWYPFKVVNKKVIPESGPVIFCSNHIHLMDQCLGLFGTVRPIHYMAKMEYFTNKKTKWFFTSVGCIPVNREIHDDNAKNAALEVLNKGLAFGIFPEGTRNSVASKKEKFNEVYSYVQDEINEKEFKKIMKKNMVRVTEVDLLISLYKKKKITKKDLKSYLYDANDSLKELVKKNIITEDTYYDNLLLPLKFGAVSMAKKTNATIVPIVITGKYKFRTKDLKVTFGTPFKVSDEMELEDANEKLKNEMINIFQDNDIFN